LAAAKFPAARKPISRPDLNETISEQTQSTKRTRAAGAAVKLASDAAAACLPIVTAASDHRVKPSASTDHKIIPGPDHVEAVLRIAVKLAEGLSHAHSRDILHRDLKPANVLVSDDGQPMLLDFNLAGDTKIQSIDRQAIIGGALPYMAPEQLAAFRDSVPQSDPRSDLFSLGMILYEMLTCGLPYPATQGTSEALLNNMLWHRQQPLPRLLRAGSAVTPAIESIVRRCLADNVQKRYQTADQLQEDLQRQLTYRPLRHAPEPSLAERLRKWTRRHPRLTSVSSIAVVSVLLVTSVVGVYQARTERLAQLEAVESLTQFQNDLQDIQVRCLDAGRSGPVEITAVKLAGEAALDRFQIRGESPWQKSPVVLRLSNSQQSKLTQAVSELLFLLSILSQHEAATISGVSEAAGKLQETLEWNERAMACFPSEKISLAFAVQREALTQRIQGTSDSAKLPLNACRSNLPLSARDACMLASLQEGQQRFREALPLWKQATTIEPQNIWAWYGLGHCHARLSQPQDALACFTACIVLRPEAADWYFHRGIANLEVRDYHQATADFSSALARQPDNLDALINRGISELRQNDTLVAIGDFAKAIRAGKKDGRVFFILAQALEKAGEIPAAAHARQREKAWSYRA
jgi:tetratricopeptide (TPR) repeat protein